MSSTSQTSSTTYLPFRGVVNDQDFFSALDPKAHQIRYVDLHPGSPTDPVVCSLGSATLDPFAREPIVYEALSYCWGSVDDTAEITLQGQPRISSDSRTQDWHHEHGECEEQAAHNGQGDKPFTGNFRVTRNLQEALCALRYKEDSRRMWIDAICINQMDAIEKTHQVKQMNKIYESAQQVVVWLGDEDEDSVLAIGALHLLRDLISSHIDKNLLWKSHDLSKDLSREQWYDIAVAFHCSLTDDTSYRDTMLELEWLPAQATEHNILLAVDCFLSRPWFRRVWVYPEVHLAKRGTQRDSLVAIRVGQCEFGWNDLVGSVRAMYELMGWGLLFRTGITPHLYWFVKSWIRTTVKTAGIFVLDMAEALENTADFLAADPRDKIFALLHLAHDSRGRMQTYAHSNDQLLPDYTKSLLEIIIDYSDTCIFLRPDILLDPMDATTEVFNFNFKMAVSPTTSANSKSKVLQASHNPTYPFQASRLGKVLEVKFGGIYFWSFSCTDGHSYTSKQPVDSGNEVVACTRSGKTFVVGRCSKDEPNMEPAATLDYRFMSTCKQGNKFQVATVMQQVYGNIFNLE